MRCIRVCPPRREDLPASGNCTSIDHRVERCPGFGLQANGVEGLARGLDPDPGQHVVLAPVLQRKAVGQGLGNRLDGESLTGISDLIDMAVARGNTNAKPTGVGFCQFRDVVCDLPLRQRGITGVQFLQVALDWRPGYQGRVGIH